MLGARLIGILGGMGPEATILLQRKLLDAVQAGDDSDHIPLLVDMNPRVPSRIAYLMEQTGEDPEPTLVSMATRLEQAGCAAIAMPCNTAHHFAPAIKQAVKIPLLDMIELAADHAVEAIGKGGCVGVLGSPVARRIGLFDNALGARGLTVIWPDHDDALLAAIKIIKSHGPSTTARETLLAASVLLGRQGADLQFIACSEFSLIADSVAPGVTAVDTLDLLTREIVSFATAA